MKFSIALCLAASVTAQEAYNQILNPGANSVIQAGGGVQSITWTNLTSGNVSLSLFSGSNPVVTVANLADSIANTGTFLWTPETWLPSGNDYTIGVQDLSGTAETQYSPFFTVQLCSTCSSSTRSTTSSISAQTVSVSGLDIGTRTDAAFPTVTASATGSNSGSVIASGVANTNSGVSTSGASGVPTTTATNLGGQSIASQASLIGASANNILSQTGSNAPAATPASGSSTTKSDARSLSAGLFSLFAFAGLAMLLS